MKRNKYKGLAFAKAKPWGILLVALLITLPSVAFAIEWWETLPLVPCATSQNPDPCTLLHFYIMVNRIIRFLLFVVAIPLSATALMTAGILMVLGGQEKYITLGKDILKFTLIGLLIAFGAWLIVDLILGNLLSDKYELWNEFPYSDD